MTWSKVQGGKLRARREKLGLSRERLAEMVGVSSRTIGNWEGASAEPRIYHLRGTANALKVALDYLRDPIPEIPTRGVAFFPALPLATRTTDVFLPLLTKLANDSYSHIPVEGFVVRHFWEKFWLLQEGEQAGRENFPRLLSWIEKGEKVVLALCGFRSRSGLEEEWTSYFKLIAEVRHSCGVVVIQPVDPFHGRLFRRASATLVAKPYPPLLSADRDLAPIADDLLDELPPCCHRTISRVLMASADNGLDRACADKLVEAEILKPNGGGFTLTHDSLRAPWTERLVKR